MSYTPANAWNNSGTLMVYSGGVVVADITVVGAYVASNYHITTGAGGTEEITDESVAAQRSGNAPATIAGGNVLEVDTRDWGKVTFGGRLAARTPFTPRSCALNGSKIRNCGARGIRGP